MSEQISRLDGVIEGSARKSEVKRSLMGAALILLVMASMAMTVKYVRDSMTYPSADDLRRVMSISGCHHSEVVNHLLSGRPLEQGDIRSVYRQCALPFKDDQLKAPVLSTEAAAAFDAQRMVLDDQHE